MAPPFVFPSTLRDLERDGDGGGDDEPALRPQNPVAVGALRAADLEEFVKGTSFDLSDKELFCIEEQDVFDRVYSLVRDFTCLPPALKFNLVETLRSNLSVLLPNIDSLSRASMSSPSDGIPVTDRIASHRNALKIYSFFLLSIVVAEESGADSCNGPKVAVHGRKKNAVYAWNWEAQRGRIMNLIANSLEVDLSLLFGPGGADEQYLSFVSKCTFVLCENQNVLKDEEIRNGLCRIIGAIATKHQRVSQTSASVLHLIHKFDFTVVLLAESVAAAEKRFGDGSLAILLIREIGRTDPKDYVRDSAGADNAGRFLVELADRLPKLMSTNIGVLIPHFGGESYKIRNSLVGVLGKLAAKAFKDVEGDSDAHSLRLRSKHAMLEILLERCRDVSAYTRSRVLQVWAELCEENAISIGLWNEVASVASGRLEDKSAIVRKSALQLLITMLQHNPFGPQLRTATFEATLERYKEKLQGMEPPSPEKDELLNDSSLGEVIAGQDESVSDSCLPSSQDPKDQDPTIVDITNLEQIRALVASLEAGLRFSACITSLMPTLVQLLASSSATDVENTILLLMRCRQFQIEGSEEALRKMLPLVFSQDKSIYEAVESAFITIYTKKSPTETAKSLLNLTIECSIGDLAALESLVSSLVSKGEISSNTITALWDYFCFHINGVKPVQSRGALSILCMAAKSSPSILGTHLQDIIDIGFGRWAKEEPLLARTACIALQRLSNEDKVKLISTGSRVFAALQGLITSLSLPEKIWYGAADKAISAIYALHPAPEIFAAQIVKKSLNSVFGVLGTDCMSNENETQNGSMLSSTPATNLGRFLFIISHIALNHLVYIETSVKKIQKQKRKNDKSEPTAEDLQADASKNSEAQGINAELGIGASVDIAIESLAEKAEREIVSNSEKNLIGYCAPFLAKLCRNLALLQKFPGLQASAMLALCKLMIIDAEFCEANLQILFTAAESAPSEVVRSNCTIALGDLVVRFPNLLEPWTEHIYARLRDPSASVRKNTVLVISHLILNDMMKVKGFINEMAVRIEDEDERISSLAKLFFHELSKKGINPIYNLLPDILGRLCNQQLKDETFCSIMQFLISSIKKDKQMEALVDKLCNRFAGVNDVRQWEYISYCLSQLTFTEKGLKKLVDNFKIFEHALSEDSVMNHFRTVIAKCKKFAKPDLKVCIEEFDEKLSKVHQEKKEQEATTRNAEAHKQRIGSLDKLMVTKRTGKDKGKSAEVAEETSEVVDPSTESNSEDKENMPECSDNICSEKSHTSSTFTESDGDSTEVQSARTSCKGVSRSRINKMREPEDSEDSAPMRRVSRRRPVR
ncbi:condensin-1 complex subunit CAP-D2 isoform X2 [Oryza sativa Japonica Group]|uniref:Condensin-1 complex subunit CAP-D2 n=2 Tax=Oryza sativa subsp. japonica TaxID=39947 RepID=Q0D3Y3_ORYSJ|nr:putative condensin subunit 1 [Oryza sativa Japonica Group]BAD30683.1 putative condensin subunit 1 [Oryza sativa Japonica Group]BAF22440.1 Os07g0659500 [Oryza sativa Japonica Group]BAT03038.1 Os07g0659500 [Oryza sativa Japonica Group]|eukprot:NP_001060526.1 Os07g0659500 [Oryza sativa Japonica Group]